ncbi:MAG: Fic family protein [Deltaproteobacteria bacterium]|nr:Fic family protein [Deltaproteobacteria bacterium]
MKEFISWINSKEITEEEPSIRAGLAHYHLALIHPFGDGNGRTARLIEALLLRTAGIKYVPIMLSNFYYRNMDEYFWTFSNSIKNKENDVTPFMEFFFRGVIDSLEDIRERITSLIRTLALRDYYGFLKGEKAITQRQHDLLTVLLEQLQPVRLVDLLHKPPFNILYGKVSERTARRDLKKLLDNKLLNLEGNNYTLNLRVLG